MMTASAQCPSVSSNIAVLVSSRACQWKAIVAISARVMLRFGSKVPFGYPFINPLAADAFNPLYGMENVYVVVNKPFKPEDKYGRFRYNLTGYTAEGQEKKITFSSSSELEQGTFVRVKSKGAYTKEWTLIQKEDIPDKALK